MKKVVLFVVLAAVLFSTMEIALKIATEVNIVPFQMTFLRFFIGGVFLLPFAIKNIKKRKIEMGVQDLKYFLILGVINIIFSMTFFQYGVNYTKASTVAVVFSTNPMFTMFFAHFIANEKITKKKVLAIIISMIGLLFILNPFNIVPGDDLKGIIFAFISSIAFGLFSAYGKRNISKYGGVAQTSFNFILGSLVLFIIILAMKQPIIAGISMSNIWILTYISVIITGLGYLLYFLAMENSNASIASITFFIKPALAPILALIILNESIASNTIIGIIFILLGSYVAFRKKKKV